MQNLTFILESCLKNTPEALAVAVVDMHSGLLIAVAHNVPYFTDTFLEAVSAAAVDIFRGKTVSAVEKMLTGLRGAPMRNMIKEAQITTDATCHFMATSPAAPDILVVLITTRRADLTASWTGVRNLHATVAPLCS